MIALDDIWSKAWGPPDRRPTKDWAAEKVTLPPVLTKRGKFSTADSRHFEAPLAALDAQHVRGVRILKPVRGGGTLIADVFVPRSIATEGCSVLWVFQDDKIAEEHAESRQWPILMSVPEIAAMLSPDRHKTRKQDILFANGLPLKLTGPALGQLQSKGYQLVVCDEPWLYKAGTLGQAKGRLGDFVKMSKSKFLAISQGGEEDSDWDFEFKTGTPYVWMPQCEACGKPMPLEWSIGLSDRTYAGAVFDIIKNADGTYDKDATATTVRYVCPHCRHEHPNTARTRSTWNLTGDYFHAVTGARFAAATCPSEVSFRWHSLIDYPWGELVKEFLAAKEAQAVGNFAPMINFYQKRCALMRSERSIHDSELQFAREKIVIGEPKEKLWPDEFARCLSVDKQSEDVYWATIRAWSKTGESRRVWRGRLNGEGDILAKQEEFGVAPDCVLVDSGYKPKGDQGVYAMCIRHGWIAVKGDKEDFFWHIEPQPNGQPSLRVQRAYAPTSWGDPQEGTEREGQRYAPLVRFSASTTADRVMELIRTGYWIEPEVDDQDEDEREYRRQMGAEYKRPKIDKFTFRKVMVWVCPTGNNHYFDNAKIQVLFAMSTGLLPSGYEPTKEPNATNGTAAYN